jgi:putative DNA-invertase from lambdoid prophage Rac
MYTKIYISTLYIYMPQVYGYLRVSTEKQNIDNEKMSILMKKDELKILGDIIWVAEIVTGKKSWRDRSLGNLYNSFNKGDTLFISEISRIERNMLGCMEFIAECSKKEINIYVCKGNFKIDNSIQSQMLIFAYSLSAQLERELISSRTKSGLELSLIHI